MSAGQDEAPVPRPATKARAGALSALFTAPWIAFGLDALVLLSAGLTFGEVLLDDAGSARPWVGQLNEIVTFIFALELALRFSGETSRRRFFREHWLDLLAVTPLLPVLGAIRGVRLLRLLRLIPLFRRRAALPKLVRRGARELILVSGVIAFTVLSASAALLAFERPTNPALHFGDTFWFSLFALFAAESSTSLPHTLGARLVSGVTMFVGLGTFATLTGTVSAFVAERIRSGGTPMNAEELSNHLIICGWNRKAEIIVREYGASGAKDQPIVVIAEYEGQPPFADASIRGRVCFINDDFTKVAALEKAGVHRAAKCIILSDTSRGRRERDADARTILAALTVEKLNPAVYTCAEINRREHGSHLEMGNVNDYVVSGEHSAFLLAQAALNPGVMSVFTELLTFQFGNQFYRPKVTKAWEGKTFFELMVHLKERHEAILIAVQSKKGALNVNPKNYRFKGDEELVVIAPHAFEL